jgi:hypothetical protein
MIQLKDISEIYPNEQLFLLLLTRVYFSTSGIDELQTFAKSRIINWDLVYKIARLHRVRPFVYHVLSTSNLDVPAQFKSKLKNDYQAAMQKNMMQALVTAEIAADLKKRGIEVISYKGASLAARYYENPAMRESVDIDFLADQKDIARIEDYLISKGFLLKEGVPRRYLAFYSRFFKDMVYRIPKYDCNVEIHWSLLNRFAGKYPTCDFFKPHTRLYKTKHGEYTVLSPSYDFLATVSNHLVKDMGIRLKYLVDISCMLSKQPGLLDDPVILETAESYGFKKKLKKGLSLVNQLVGIPIPDNYLSELDIEDISVPLAYPTAISRLQFNDRRFVKRSLALQDNLTNKIRLLFSCFSYFFIPSYLDINAYRLPAFFLPLLFFLRPFRLLAQKIRLVNGKTSIKKN